MNYYIITFGCQMNKSDSERIEAVFEKEGLSKASSVKEADFLVVNMCSVRQSSVDRVYGLKSKIESLKKENPTLKTILTGCVLNKDKENFEKFFDFVLNIKDLPEWPKILKFKKVSSPADDYLKIPPEYSSFPVAWVPISTGCNNFCAYCVVPYTRGRERYRKSKDILCEIKKLVSKGFKEIWLLGENVNSYKDEVEGVTIDFADLLKNIDEIEGDFWLRFTSPHPKNFSEKLIKTISDLEKFAPYLNLPLQSGSNKILKKMFRGYTQEQYLRLSEKIKKAVPGISLSTDIIVGFPGETEEDFNETVKVFKKVKFDMAYIARYSPRPGTAASKMKDDIPSQEKKRREKILTELLEKYALKFNKKFINKTLKVLPLEYKEGTILGVTPHHKKIKFKGPKNIIGKFVKVKVKKASAWGLEGQLIPNKLIVILGPTAVGKTALSIKLAKKFNGEIVSADSRQVYKGMDIGTGKVTKTEMQNVPHYLLDVVSPKTEFSVAQYQKKALKAIDKILEKGKVPFLVGGSPFYIYSVVETWQFPKMKKNPKLRRSLEKRSAQELFEMLKKLDPQRAQTIEKQNKRRLIRAIEIAKTLGKVPPLKKNPRYECLILGVKKSRPQLKKLIKERLLKRLRQGMINEVKKLHQNGVSWSRLESFGLEYRWVARYLKGEIKKEEMIEKLQKDIEEFARRQMTWFKRDPRVHWIKNQKEAEKLIKNFLKDKEN